ncbi:MAG: 2-C-methyl-D-erythritol 4-phosphate cytidylyltransferase [Bacteroidetes bacterium GWF2_40_14]|nr:MAG: 2-C-methyl-D-erythritol 4-phosphate cytidylyltransferase [Bacteroidetes bacterium GWF2_40_14]
MNKKYYAVIVAGGTGARMGGDVAKQFLTLGDKPIILHSIEAFLRLSFPVEIILVVPTDYRQYWKDYCLENHITFSHILVSGGITRFHSVKNALKYIPKGALVAIHDGVRPFISSDFVESLFVIAEEKGAVAPVVNVIDSMRKRVTDGRSVYVKREEFVLVQTPQVFHSDIILDAYNQAYSPGFTDDASVVESVGKEVYLTEGNSCNIKITKPEDLVLARAILSVF